MYKKNVQMLKAIKIQLYPNQEQMNYMNNLLGSVRFVYNNCLAFKIESYNNEKKNVGFAELGRYLTELKQKEEFTWLNDVHSKVLQQSLINLNQAYSNFFKNGFGFPKFKSRKSYKQSCRFPKDAIGNIEENKITLIKQLKNINFRCSERDKNYLNAHQEDIHSATLIKTKSNKYFLSILVEFEKIKILPKTNKIIGIDLGIKDFIVTSSNEKFENIKIIRNNEEKLKKLHQNLSKKKNGSKNKEKARIKLARFNEKLNNKKDFYLHQISNQLLDENQVIIMEDLDVKSMLQNHQLARSIQELSLYTFKSILKYKAKWYGRDIIEINKFFPSSKLCSSCGYKKDDLELKDRNWVCPECGAEHERDLNAAKNILKEGKRILEIKENKIGLSRPESTLVESNSLESR